MLLPTPDRIGPGRWIWVTRSPVVTAPRQRPPELGANRPMARRYLGNPTVRFNSVASFRGQGFHCALSTRYFRGESCPKNRGLDAETQRPMISRRKNLGIPRTNLREPSFSLSSTR